MSDPVSAPLPQEDTFHVDQAPPRVNAPPSRKEAQARLFQHQTERENTELSRVLATDEGQSVILRILDRCGIYADTHMTDLQQGKRLVGLGIIQAIGALGAEVYPTLLIQHARRQQRQRDEDRAVETNINAKKV